MYNLVKPVKDWICGQCGEELETCAEFMEHVNHFHTRLNRNGKVIYSNILFSSAVKLFAFCRAINGYNQ
jgi:hypothetical protein